MKRTVPILLSALIALAPAADAAESGRKPARKRAAQPPVAAERATAYASQPALITAFADEMAAKRGLDPASVRSTLAQAQRLPSVIKLMQPAPAGTAKNWRAYRARFIEPVRVEAGLRFWSANRETLERAEKEFGVPAEIIVGIVGVETLYGRHMGNFRVLDALATLAFDFPASHPRAAERTNYFRGELEQFLAWHAQAGTDPLAPRGSYAGAMGMPQFMPTSQARWAVDYDGDRRIDLTGSVADVIGSVANYFKGFGWKPGMPTHYPVGFDRDKLDLEGLLVPDILPTFSVAAFQAKGAMLEGEATQHAGPLALVELQNGSEAPQYVAGTENFYVVTRYNWSSYYAMAVIELGREVRHALERQALATPR